MLHSHSLCTKSFPINFENNSEKVLFPSLEQLYSGWENSTNFNCTCSHILERLQLLFDNFYFRDFFFSIW